MVWTGVVREASRSRTGSCSSILIQEVSQNNSYIDLIASLVVRPSLYFLYHRLNEPLVIARPKYIEVVGLALALALALAPFYAWQSLCEFSRMVDYCSTTLRATLI